MRAHTLTETQQWLSLFSVTVNMRMHSFIVLGEVAVSLTRQSVISAQ